MVLAHAGLRGAIAYALSLNFPITEDANGRSVTSLVVNATTFTILVSVFLLGPTTPPLLKCLKIPMGKGYVSGSSTAHLRPWQKKVQAINQNKLLTWLTKNPDSHSFKDQKPKSKCIRRVGFGSDVFWSCLCVVFMQQLLSANRILWSCLAKVSANAWRCDDGDLRQCFTLAA